MLDELIKRYERCVASLLEKLPLDIAMATAVGGDCDHVGSIEAELLQSCGLQDGQSIIDLGCGSGRLAKQLGKRLPQLNYIGTDIVQSLLDYAASQCPPHFRFVLHKHLSIPAADNSADFVVAFSLFTHLLYEHSFNYLKDAVRVVRPSSTILFSFLEMETHWQTFEWTLTQVNLADVPLNMFMERPTVEAWAKRLGLTVERYVPMGQTVVVLKRAP